MIDGRVIRGVDANGETFKRTHRRIKSQSVQRQVLEALRLLLFLNLDQPPAKLHMHQLAGKQVTSALDPRKKVNVWTIHVTPDDSYKASFTLEDGVAYIRLCDEHDVIDKNP